MTEPASLHDAEKTLEATRAKRYAVYAAYKPSEVDWLGDLPETWGVKRLKYIASINDETLPETTDPAYEFTYVDIGNVSATHGIMAKESQVFENAPSRARRIVRDGDTIVSTVRTYLRAIAPVREPEDNLIVSTGFAVIHPRDIDPDYLSFALRSPYFVETVVSRSTGVSYPAINASEVGHISLPLPSADEQQAIARFLDEQTKKIDDLIEAKRDLLRFVEEKKQSVISHAVIKGLRSDVSLTESPHHWLGDIPDHWKYMPIKWVVETPVTDGPHETPEWVDEGVPFVSAEGVFDGRVHLDRCRGMITPDQHREYSKKACPKRDDIFIVKSGATTGKVGYVDFDDEFNIWSPLALIRCDQRIVLPRYAYYAFIETSFLRQVQLFWSYGTQPNIGMGDLQNLVIAVPPLDEQKQVIAHLESEVGKLDALAAEAGTAIENLGELRTGMISAAVTGKIDVRGGAA